VPPIILLSRWIDFERARSTLALLVALVLANDAHHAFSPDDLAMSAYSLYRASYFHDDYRPSIARADHRLRPISQRRLPATTSFELQRREA
jgi:hypothetical protein